LNSIIIDELSDRIGKKDSTLVDSFDWFIGGGIDSNIVQALDDDDQAQKDLSALELKNVA
jgi:hypothetical protein